MENPILVTAYDIWMSSDSVKIIGIAETPEQAIQMCGQSADHLVNLLREQGHFFAASYKIGDVDNCSDIFTTENSDIRREIIMNSQPIKDFLECDITGKIPFKWEIELTIEDAEIIDVSQDSDDYEAIANAIANGKLEGEVPSTCGLYTTKYKFIIK